MKYLFIDPVCPKPYSIKTLEEGTLGGTEATVLRITQGLASHGNNVTLAQRGRTGVLQAGGNPSLCQIGLYQGFWEHDVVVILRDAGHYAKARQEHQAQKHYLWLHDVVSGAYLEHLVMHLGQLKGVHIICVSTWHMQQVRNALAPYIPLDNLHFRVIYNPLAGYCIKEPGQEYDRYQLVFFSSPHKGLDQVLTVFNELRKKAPLFQLYIANPGYFPSHDQNPEGVINLGSCTHRKIIEKVRNALCVFYPQTVFPETFGLVLAESNAVGTPVIAHPIGAAPEILSHPAQLLDCTNTDLVIDTVLRWSNGERPILRGDPNFLIGNVMKQWQLL